MRSEAPPPTILIVDDEALTRGVLGDLLSNECRVLMARDGASALALMEREDVHLVLLDVSMAGMSGYEVLARMRSVDRLVDVPVIFITSMSDETDEEFGLALGAADYVQKPIRPAIVRARVLTHLRLAVQRQVLASLAAKDGLTGVANRRSFDQALELAIRRACRTGASLAVGLFDVDHFKQYNDRYGHGAGDDVLRQVASLLAGCARRAGDLLARYGGEEFVVMTEHTQDLNYVMRAANRAVEAAAIVHEGSTTSQHLTISGGGVIFPVSREVEARDILERADAMLYRAKAEGRNRVLIDTYFENTLATNPQTLGLGKGRAKEA